MTIFMALTESQQMRTEAEARYRCFSPSTPQDADDFSRCQYLLALVPEWKVRLAEVGSKFPGTPWRRLAARWTELDALFVSSDIHELNKRLNEVNSAAPNAQKPT
jgi:hypothetical protein